MRLIVRGIYSFKKALIPSTDLQIMFHGGRKFISGIESQLAKVLCGTVVIQNSLCLLRTKYGHKTLLSVPIYLSNFAYVPFKKLSIPNN